MRSPLATLNAAGFWAESDGCGRLTAGPRRKLSADTRAFIAAHRDTIVDELEATRLAETTRNILALSPAELARYRRELATASPDDPWLSHDATALARALAQMNARAA
jgi:hypothetical protein